ncbi:TPA: DEAD/DEAH box helicase family protein [Corynebacterium aurimucosum]|nr:DEAD/DEAH box helicase family protein [Corynebacterium aurimucosum]
MTTPTSHDMFLFQQLDLFYDFGKRHPLPAHIKNNLSDRIALREYQEHAFSNTLEYLENTQFSKNRQTHLLYHMATGSGKTVMMAGLILHYYSLGYRNFIFFVNQSNIIEKTRSNFLDVSSTKYLFADAIEIDGVRVRVNEVSNFASTDPHAINLCFTTTQQLHYDFFDAKEDSLTISDFEDTPVVLISDESHHVNTRTKKATKTEAEEDRSWEYVVNTAFQANRENVLLEFTATVDLRDPNILAKYKNKIVFDYPLARFRESGFTKDFKNFQSVLDPWGRTLQALILSEYRRSLFADLKVAAKPVVLLKSQRVDDSRDFYEEFFRRLKRLTPDEIRGLDSEGLIHEAIDYFSDRDPSLHSLCLSLQHGFDEENAIIMNGKTDNSAEKQLAVNSLEDVSNPYRIIFTVDMLNEGWDVLNLYDIVRLYETRQGGKAGKPGAYTIKEAQLIGRGARYFPFLPDDGELDIEPDEAFVRKYDYDLGSPYRLLETLLYHSKQDSKYINELRTALRGTGLLPPVGVEVTYELKESFKKSTFFHEAQLFSNRRVEVSRDEVTALDNRVKSALYQVDVRRTPSTLNSLLDEEPSARTAVSSTKSVIQRKKISDIPANILLGTLARFDGLRFDVLRHYFPSLKSAHEFVSSNAFLGDVEIVFQSDNRDLTAVDLVGGLSKVFESVARYLETVQVAYRGTTKFYPRRLSEVLRDKKLQISEVIEGGFGDSQTRDQSKDHYVDLDRAEWYVFNDNFGTSEEKAFVKYFASVVEDLKQAYDEVYLIRNERLAPLAIYSFETGERFEPDFLLLLRKDGDVVSQQQIYIEPKGGHLLETDQWKEDFLLSLDANAIPHKVYVDNTDYRIIGLPFFNEENRMSEFSTAFSSAVDPNRSSQIPEQGD